MTKNVDEQPILVLGGTGKTAVLTELFGKVMDGRNAQLADGVQRALGRRPRDFTDYARDAAAAGAWNISPAGEWA